MTAYLGVDGCRAGWFWISFEKNDRPDFGIVPHIEELWRLWADAALILIDIPIGLRDCGEERRVDKAARQILKGRASSVYPVLCRPALACDDYQAASQVNYERTGRKLSKQSWAIAPKIRQVDSLLQGYPAARAVLHETHPELIFWAVNAGRPMPHNKKTDEGYAERLSVLQEHYPEAASLVQGALRKWQRSQVARDDILDALANAIAAWKSRRSLQSIPEDPEFDATGLPMQMVYYLSD